MYSNSNNNLSLLTKTAAQKHWLEIDSRSWQSFQSLPITDLLCTFQTMIIVIAAQIYNKTIYNIDEIPVVCLPFGQCVHSRAHAHSLSIVLTETLTDWRAQIRIIIPLSACVNCGFVFSFQWEVFSHWEVTYLLEFCHSPLSECSVEEKDAIRFHLHDTQEKKLYVLTIAKKSIN